MKQAKKSSSKPNHLLCWLSVAVTGRQIAAFLGIGNLSPQSLASRIDHTILKAETTPSQIEQLCEEAKGHQFAAVCVNSVYVPLAGRCLRGSSIPIASVVGFPLGANLTASKVDEARRAIDAGAREIDMVIQLGGLIAGEKNLVRDDISAVADAVHAASPSHLIKVILETAALNSEQITLGCRCCAEAQVDFVKTSTGFHLSGGATLEAVQLLRRYCAPIKVKASGGIRDLKTALAMIDAGADRLGLSSSVAIINELKKTGGL